MAGIISSDREWGHWTDTIACDFAFVLNSIVQYSCFNIIQYFIVLGVVLDDTEHHSVYIYGSAILHSRYRILFYTKLLY